MKILVLVRGRFRMSVGRTLEIQYFDYENASKESSNRFESRLQKAKLHSLSKLSANFPSSATQVSKSKRLVRIVLRLKIWDSKNDFKFFLFPIGVGEFQPTFKIHISKRLTRIFSTSVLSPGLVPLSENSTFQILLSV